MNNTDPTGDMLTVEHRIALADASFARALARCTDSKTCAFLISEHERYITLLRASEHPLMVARPT